MLSSQIASLANIASNYLVAGQEATRWGTSHPSIVPYQVFTTKDSFIMASAGNDTQFSVFSSILGRPEWATDERFNKNAKRVENRIELVELIEQTFKQGTTAEWCEKLTGKGLPFACVQPSQLKLTKSPINNIAQTFDHPQARARGVVEEVDVSV